ncbi:HEAT repeat domain-containing protein [Gimesia aquarii]|uniref:HEAT repeat protein n=1 Tax=Gimesia aquarii TaxID=2527964 RepID=A0A517X3X3_9PLAN|nr:HEAT repeat domain-containing protein [Gimesia aquarii]QDU12204.1 HEAT repeat protein [Gimesia aquarii]
MDSRSMQGFKETSIVCAFYCVWMFQGCGSSDSTSDRVSETAPHNQNEQTAVDLQETTKSSQGTAITSVEPVDPQMEVKAVFQKLVAIRNEPEPDEWLKADKQLSAFGKTAVPTLIAELGNPELSARELASMYLAGLGPEAKEAAPALEKALKEDSPFIQVNAASTLTHFPEYQGKAVPVLITLSKHEDPHTRLTSIYALGSLNPHSDDQLKAIKAALNDSDADVQLAAIKVLGQIGDPAKQTLKDLQTLIDDSNTNELLREAALSSKSLIEKSKQ